MKQKRTSQDRRSDRRERKKRKTAGDVVSMIVLIVAVCVFIFALYQLVMMLIPYYSGGEEYDKVKALAITSDEDTPEEDDRFRVDFEVLRAENPDVVAWIRFDEPSIISYPVVKSKDNNEYLTKTFSANDNKLGAIFMDMNNDSTFNDRNTMIYGHNLKIGGEMFSQLSEYADQSFCAQYPYFYIYTPDGKEQVYQVFTAGVVKDTADNYILTYNSDEEFLNYLETCKSGSNYIVDVEVNEQSKIVSLSTCTNVYEDERFMVQGVLVETNE